MSIADRLARLTAPRPGAAAPIVASPPIPHWESGLPEAEQKVKTNRFFRRTTVFPLDHVHGAHRVAEVAALDPRDLAALCDAAPAWPGAPVFFDTETTSLASGAGVYVFLVGFAEIRAGALVVDQLWLDDPSAEGEFLLAAGERVLAAPLLVSFSGRGFDERRLEDRYRFLRQPSPFVRARHADLCPLARALWRGRLGSCALGALEPARLGFRRTDDLPGEHCPEAYFRSLRGDLAAREAVLRHNLLDLLSTATLAVALDARARGGADPAEKLGLAQHLRRRGRGADALALLAALEAPPALHALTPAERRTLALEAASLLKRAGRHADAAARWRSLTPPCFESLFELAKHAEHRAHDLDLAARCTAEALSLLRCRRVDVSESRRALLDGELVKRLARIEAKASRHAMHDCA